MREQAPDAIRRPATAPARGCLICASAGPRSECTAGAPATLADAIGDRLAVAIGLRPVRY